MLSNVMRLVARDLIIRYYRSTETEHTGRSGAHGYFFLVLFRKRKKKSREMGRRFSQEVPEMTHCTVTKGCAKHDDDHLFGKHASCEISTSKRTFLDHLSQHFAVTCPSHMLPFSHTNPWILTKKNSGKPCAWLAARLSTCSRSACYRS